MKFKRHTEYITIVQFTSNLLSRPMCISKAVFLTIVYLYVNYWIGNANYRLFEIDNCQLKHVAPSFVRGQNGF